MIIGIEGTGSQDWLDDDLQRSFVRRVLNETGLRPASYFIGPNVRASDGEKIIDYAYTTLTNGAHVKPIVLVGYSRGAAYCLELARRYGKQGGIIDVMILFDAVARQGDFPIPENIPANVKVCYHAHRDPRAGSRYFFSNVGITSDQKAPYFLTKHMFFGSHGAMGGTYYDAADEEHVASKWLPGVSTNRVSQWTGNGIDMFQSPYIKGVLTGQGPNPDSSLTPNDRDGLPIPRTPVTHLLDDQAASVKVAQWMWPRMIDAGVLPGNANALAPAPSYKGSKLAGVRNIIH